MRLTDKIANIAVAFETKIGGERAGMIYMVFALAAYQSMTTFVKVTSGRINVYHTSFLRGFFHFLFSYYLNLETKTPCIHPNLKTNHRIIVRNIIGSIHNLILTYLISRIPYSEIFTFVILGPLVVSLMDFLINKTVYKKIELFSLFLGIFGLLTIVKPELIYGIPPKQSHAASGIDYAQGLERTLLMCLMVFSIIIWSYSNLMLKSFKNVSTITVNFSIGGILAVLSGLGIAFSGKVSQLTFNEYLGAFFFAGFASFISQLFYARAFQKGKPGHVAMILGTQLLFTMCFESIYLAEIPTYLDLFGATLTMSSNILVALFAVNKK